jgi:hypothetical protein
LVACALMSWEEHPSPVHTHTHTHTHTQAKVKVVVVAAAAEKECEPVGMPQEGALGNSFLKCFHQMCLPTAVQKL